MCSARVSHHLKYILIEDVFQCLALTLVIMATIGYGIQLVSELTGVVKNESMRSDYQSYMQLIPTVIAVLIHLLAWIGIVKNSKCLLLPFIISFFFTLVAFILVLVWCIYTVNTENSRFFPCTTEFNEKYLEHHHLTDEQFEDLKEYIWFKVTLYTVLGLIEILCSVSVIYTYCKMGKNAASPSPGTA
ncbi:hypothetical protein QR680_014141 [Steinernema hermaphroditum]|uniref:Uncharacterized protein n=1 Tax=Steinernema hermaphroditum TaxID=289476 RepID=A0AA39M3P8_9BILA|nr:hypothetical protein QR680_014141 [Steinernema hermaphroditum]